MLLLESDWQFQIPHQQGKKYKKPIVKCQTPLSVGEVWVRGTRLISHIILTQIDYCVTLDCIYMYLYRSRRYIVPCRACISLDSRPQLKGLESRLRVE